MEYIYYDPITKQVEAVFNTPFLAVQSAWDAKGLQRAIVPDGMVLKTRDFKIDSVVTSGENEFVEMYSVSVNPVTEPEPSHEDIKETYRLASADEKQAMLAQRMGFI